MTHNQRIPVPISPLDQVACLGRAFYRSGTLALHLTNLLGYSPALYAATLSLVRLLVTLVFTNRLLRQFHVHVHPLHPDGAGGLGVFGRLLTVSVLIAAIVGAAATGLIIAAYAAGLDPLDRAETVLLGLIYVLLTPLLLIGWLWSPHRAMVEARDTTLQPLADEFLRAIPHAMPTTQDTAATIKTNTDRLVELKRQYDLLHDSFPVWPMRTTPLRGLVATAVLPLITGLISALANTIVGLMK